MIQLVVIPYWCSIVGVDVYLGLVANLFILNPWINISRCGHEFSSTRILILAGPVTNGSKWEFKAPEATKFSLQRSQRPVPLLFTSPEWSNFPIPKLSTKLSWFSSKPTFHNCEPSACHTIRAHATPPAVPKLWAFGWLCDQVIGACPNCSEGFGSPTRQRFSSSSSKPQHSLVAQDLSSPPVGRIVGRCCWFKKLVAWPASWEGHGRWLSSPRLQYTATGMKHRQCWSLSHVIPLHFTKTTIFSGC